MKSIYILIFILSTINCLAQTQIIDSIPPNGILLNKGWKFTTGDNIAWAQPNFIDSNWANINPSLDIHEIPQLKAGVVGWFRVRFKISDSSKQLMALIIHQSGASEIFLDGKQIVLFGTIDNNAANVKAFDPLFKPLLVSVSGSNAYVLAIRYALEPGVRYTTMFESRNDALLVHINSNENAIDYFEKNNLIQVGFLFFTSGVCFLLFILHFAFFIFYRSQRANLMLALYALGFFIFNVIQLDFFVYNNIVAAKFYLGNIAMDLRAVYNFILLSAIYDLLKQPKDKVYKGLFVFIFLSFILNACIYDIGWKLGGVLMEVFVGIATTRAAFLATRKKKRGAKIILFGAVSYFIFFIAFFQQAIFSPQDILFVSPLNLGRTILYVLSFLSIPVATSVSLGLEFAFANKALKQTLTEVNDLSEKNLRTEKEKQEILANQNVLLEQQVTQRTAELNTSLNELKSTQAQLIQSEKMASLGELTAGIAHEIQNPLNFVNNFSEVNDELINELVDEVNKGNTEEVKAIATDIKQNLEKINHHGKRADAIVKGMLQHSRKSEGKKEPTDINALCDEYLRLSYHGLRAKDKEFNANFKTDFDESIGKINIVPQDISIVLLNLYNNAFYAVNEKAKQQLNGYEPTISVSTKLSVPSPLERGWGEAIILTVMDNGNGIPQNIVDKIFQPFFTTKPTGQGTGLGLSLSYDIITKEHNGSIKVESKEGEGTSFIIQLIIT